MYRRDIGYTDPYDALMSPYLRYFQQDQQRTRRDIESTTGGTTTPVQRRTMQTYRASSNSRPHACTDRDQQHIHEPGPFYQDRNHRQ